MNTYTIKKIFLFTFLLLLGMLISVNWSAKNGILMGIHSAYAEVGKPLSPGSAAGVHRRHEKREYRQTTGEPAGHVYGNPAKRNAK